MKELDFKEILVRRPFYKVLPKATVYKGQATLDNLPDEHDDSESVEILTQADMLRQYWPTSHDIMNPVLYPDVWKEMPVPGKPNQKRLFRQPITRTAFAFQRTIKIKHVTHLCGNDIQHELVTSRLKKATDEKDALYVDFLDGCINMNTDLRFFEFVDAYKTVGDAAVVAYFNEDGTPGTKTLSYLGGDKLYPHYDSLTGELEVFARKYRDIDEDGNTMTEWVEVWDKKYLYRAKRGSVKSGLGEKLEATGALGKAISYGLFGFTIVSKEEHGFECVPVAYFRNEEGACWAFSQQTIEHYEEAVSYFFENNKAYAFPIFFVKGKGVKLSGDMKGAVKAISIADPKGEAGFLNQADVSTSYNTLLNMLYERIFEQSFAVRPPELKSGDLPGVAVKLLFSPAIENAINDAARLQPFIDKLTYLVKWAWGAHIGRQPQLVALKTRSWIMPYIHQNQTEIYTNLAQAVANGFLSKQTASERAPEFPKTDEYERIMREDLEKRRRNLQDKVDEIRAQLESKIRQEEETAKLNNRYGTGTAVNTGHGGRPNTLNTDKWGNREGENNWSDWNANH